ncbi:hypothetical protein J6590_070594 [Homalodisca vitripennis]|nr:hypothetical protein J6590_070594 [Homalodisca vitripennis]
MPQRNHALLALVYHLSLGRIYASALFMLCYLSYTISPWVLDVYTVHPLTSVCNPSGSISDVVMFVTTSEDVYADVVMAAVLWNYGEDPSVLKSSPPFLSFMSHRLTRPELIYYSYKCHPIYCPSLDIQAT